MKFKFIERVDEAVEYALTHPAEEAPAAAART
jgi:hypothetical protein